jgi:hypothetical protein
MAMKKSPEGLDALNAITDKVLAYSPPKKNKKARKRPEKAVIVATGLSLARMKEAKKRRGKLPKDEWFSPRQPLVPLT